MLEHVQLTSGANTIDVRVATPTGRATSAHTLMLVHGLPRTPGMGRQAAALLPELAEHLAAESGWKVITGTFSGVGSSSGSFTPEQWSADLAVLTDYCCEDDRTLALAGFGFGGVLSLSRAAADERVRGVATFATPAHLEQWMVAPEHFHAAVQDAGLVTDVPAFPDAATLWNDMMALSPLGAISEIPPRRLLIGHGSDDLEVPVNDARDLVSAADGRAELRIIQSAGHQLRADPRMVATLLGWLDRHR